MITANYNGNSNDQTSTGTLSQAVNPTATKTVIRSNRNPSVYGQSVTFTSTVTVVSPGAGSPTGSVEFYEGATDLGADLLDSTGKATFVTSTLAAGTHSIQAIYNGDVNFSGSTSAILSQVVRIAPAPVAPKPVIDDHSTTASVNARSDLAITILEDMAPADSVLCELALEQVSARHRTANQRPRP